MKIKLAIVLDAIETADDAFTYFYDTQTEDVIVLSDLDSYEEKEAIADAIDSDMDRYLCLPTKSMNTVSWRNFRKHIRTAGFVLNCVMPYTAAVLSADSKT